MPLLQEHVCDTRSKLGYIYVTIIGWEDSVLLFSTPVVDCISHVQAYIGM